MRMLLLGVLLLWQTATPGQAFAKDREERPARHQPMNASYRQQLLALADADQKIRGDIRGAVTAQQLQANQGAAKEMAMRLVASQRENQAALSRLIDQFGFPDIASVGEDGAHAGFLIAQHSTDRAFRDDFLQKMQAAAERGAYSAPDLALFIDRNLIMSGKPQRYGTQRKADGSLFELENPADLKKRRAEAGLPEEEGSAGGL
ncbi:DUF6624 domain-containing protein [Xanthomonas dyei]|uniref:Uncharacterized protein n=1 Tax=Xanthomonas dyei TaxID=743699 RepID=A0A2S7C806_9XANT|nr:DUF6624 domain-containing protein [Xanthomonas dyei]MCC4632668.1 hypothetical protein [Xanthomonas dyei pv. eucalypti]PPU57712.1 hypothetical protein XdyCFBP7245_05730 [Xanthomonas dyei]WOB26138.1 hypothetical protein NYR99_21190 [Xanthomonas dyei]WOB53762.1 hypothetical protein NYR95_21195 [Xanthomonas dyei]